MRHGRTALQGVFLLIGLSIGIPLFAQKSLYVSNESTFPGNSIQAQVLGDTDEPIMAFTFGLRHDAARLTPTLAVQGAAALATNGGLGAEYFVPNLAAFNGPGITVACLFTIAAPDEIPIGIGHELVVMTYDTNAASPPASTTLIVPAADLGTPAVNIVFTVSGVSAFPTTTNGSVFFDVPAPTGVTCALTNSCTCAFSINWTNGAAYDSVEVRLDGGLVATLPGGATSANVSLPGPGTGSVCVRGVVAGTGSADSCCTANCPVVVPAPPPTGLTCAIASSDPSGCTVDVSWTLAGVYTAIDVTVGGVVVATLPGGATTTTVSLPIDPIAEQVCLLATDECGVPLSSSVCCGVTCLPGPIFRRGDCNDDGGIDIADVIRGLDILFSGAAAAACDDSCDNNDDGGFDISDAVYLLATLFTGGPPPPAPNPACGIDPTADPLGCVANTSCP